MRPDRSIFALVSSLSLLDGAAHILDYLGDDSRDPGTESEKLSSSSR